MEIIQSNVIIQAIQANEIFSQMKAELMKKYPSGYWVQDEFIIPVENKDSEASFK